jgi:hypothetical protein
MRAIAWDDEIGRDSYLKRVAKHLQTFGVVLDLEKSVDKFLQRLREDSWDFVITDLQGSDKSKELEPGLTIARRLAHEHQVFIVTSYMESLNRDDHGIPANVVIKSKSLHAGWMAEEIVNDLRRLGLYVKHDRVFLIYGHDRQMPGLKQKVEYYLKTELGLKVEVIQGGNLRQEILDGLVTRMSDCGAFVVLCTPDDEIHDSTGKLARCQPRQNVLLELGLAAGMGRGLERLVILQKWGPSIEHQAQLPSDLGGVVPIRMEGEFEHYKEALKDTLKRLRIDVR